MSFPKKSIPRSILAAWILPLVSAATADLVVDGSPFTLSSANSYTGSTHLLNGGSLFANVVGALPTSPRSDVFLDQTGSGGSTLILGASQVAASLSGATTSQVQLNAHTLTIGAATVPP